MNALPSSTAGGGGSTSASVASFASTVVAPGSGFWRWRGRKPATRGSRFGARFVIGVPYLFLVLFFSAPFLIILKYSVSIMGDVEIEPLLRYVEDSGVWQLSFKLSNYVALAGDEIYRDTWWLSFRLALYTTLWCLALGYPFAYFMARSPQRWRPALLMLVSLPFWTSYLLRIYAWKTILEQNGIINNLLTGLGLIQEPLVMMHTPGAVLVGMVYTYIPFMILPLYATLVKLDLRLLEAAADLGAGPLKAFWLITVPLSKAGIIAGSMLVFIPSIGEYVIPELMGGSDTQMIGRTIWDEFYSNNDWPRASSVAVSMMALILIPLMIFNHYQTQTASVEERKGAA